MSMKQLRAEAEDMRRAKHERMGLKISTADLENDRGTGKTGPAADGTQGEAQGRYASEFSSDDGKVSKAKIDHTTKPSGMKAKARLDRAGYASGGRVGNKGKATTVNVVVAGAPTSTPPSGLGSTPGAPPMPLPLPAAGGAPVLGAGAPPPGMPPVPMRKRGGRVGKTDGIYPKMTAGAMSGEGRLEKVAAYGKKSRR